MRRDNTGNPTFFRRLRVDRAGNTLALMAAMMLPMVAMAGSAVDTARLYVVKVRLQQACDAGALAGRKFMVADDSPVLDANAAAQASTFFKNNFKAGWMKTTNVSFTPSKTADNQVYGTAQATVPMALMGMFGMGPSTLTVTCQARFDTADTDVIFVLDTTGSMACGPSDPDSCGQATVSYTRPDGTTGYYVQEKSNSRISALRAAVLSFYDTVASSMDPSSKVRYGFVPYTSTVNVGAAITAIDPGYMVKSWTYDSRRMTSSGRTPQWRNEAVTLDVSQFVAGASVPDPTKTNGAKSKWQGCIEERDTVVAPSFDPNNLPPDLDPDLKPWNDATRWRPMWPEVLYWRGSNNSVSTNGDSSTYFQFADPNLAYLKGGYMVCGKAAQRLQVMARADVSAYVNSPDFRPWGGTYHDTGMIWGTRLISPTGIFAADTAAWPGRQDPRRFIVFMTDGHMATNDMIYGMYGWETYDKRTTGGNGQGDAYHDARFLAECQAAKNRNITVFVVSLAASLDASLSACASPGQAYFASDSAALTAAFQTIAKQVAMLRLSQ